MSDCRCGIIYSSSVGTSPLRADETKKLRAHVGTKNERRWYEVGVDGPYEGAASTQLSRAQRLQVFCSDKREHVAPQDMSSWGTEVPEEGIAVPHLRCRTCNMFVDDGQWVHEGSARQALKKSCSTCVSAGVDDEITERSRGHTLITGQH